MIKTKVLEDPTGEYQFHAAIEEQFEIQALNKFYNYWNNPQQRDRIIKNTGIRIALMPRVSSFEDTNPLELNPPNIADFILLKANR